MNDSGRFRRYFLTTHLSSGFSVRLLIVYCQYSIWADDHMPLEGILKGHYTITAQTFPFEFVYIKNKRPSELYNIPHQAAY